MPKYKPFEKKRIIYRDIDKLIEANLNKFKNPDVKKWMNKWVDEKKANGISLNQTVKYHLYTFQKVLDPLDKPIQKIIDNNDEEAIRRLLKKIADEKGEVKTCYRTALKSFFKWANSGEHPKATKWVSYEKSLDEVKPEIKLLTHEEKEAIIKNAIYLRDRVIFRIMCEIPTRPKDILNLKYKDVEPNAFGYKMKFHSKTQAGFRTVQLIHSVPDLRLYLSEHKFKTPESPLFYSYGHKEKNKCEHLSYQTLLYGLKEACKRGKIGRWKEITLYHFRKTTASELLQDPAYTPREVMVLGGWSDISTMMGTYGKVSDEMVNLKQVVEEAKNNLKFKKELLIQAKTNKNLKHNLIKFGLIKTGEVIEEEKLNITCPRCGEKNPTNVDSCVKCWLPLSQKIILKLENKNKLVQDENSKLATKYLEMMAMPNIAQDFVKLMEKAKKQYKRQGFMSDKEAEKLAEEQEV